MVRVFVKKKNIYIKKPLMNLGKISIKHNLVALLDLTIHYALSL